MNGRSEEHDRTTHRLWGTITAAAAGTVPPNAMVRAYDGDLANESLLGESVLGDSGRYEIRYSPLSYVATEAGTVDVIVRVVDHAGNKLAESEVQVNAPRDLEVNLEIDTAVMPTEYEHYLALLGSVRQDVPLADLTDKNIEFLAKELELPIERITMLRTAAQNARSLLASVELLYAFQRADMGSTAAELNQHDRETLVAAVKQAVDQYIVSPIDPALLERVLVRLDQVRADLDSLANVVEGSKVDGVDKLLTTLEAKGLHSLGDLKSPEGFNIFAEAERESPGPALEFIRSHANLSAVAPDLGVRNELLRSEYRGIGDVASSGLDEFLTNTEGRIDPFVATTLHTQASLLQQFIKKALLETRLDLTRESAVSETPTGTLISAMYASEAGCDCSDCESAVSPLPYLADLLKYCYDSLRDGTRRVDYLRLGQELHQKFADLPTKCGAVEEEVRQVRIAIEVLRAHLSTHQPSVPEATKLQNAERDYLRAAYELLLVRIGTSYADLRLAIVAPPSDQAELAERIGIRAAAGAVNHVRDLLVDVSGGAVGAIEGLLEKLFGLKDTRKDPLAAKPTPDLLIWRREHLRDLWLGQDWPDDTPGLGVALIDPDVIGPDDLRYADPSQVVGAFEVWRRRRAWVDQQVSSLLALVPAAQSSRLDAMVDAMFVQTGAGALPPYPLTGGATVAARAWPTSKTALLALADVLSAGTKTAVSGAVATLANSYGLSVDALQRLIALRDKDLVSVPTGSMNAPPTDAEVREFASILTQSRKRLHAADWATEEQTAQTGSDPNLSLEFGPADFWISLTEPDVGEWPPVDDGRSPWIDPDLVKLSDLPDSSIGSGAVQLWGMRRQALQDYKTNQIGPARRTRFDDALGSAFGALPTSLPAGVTTWGGYVEDTLQRLGSSVPADVTTGRTRLSQTLFLGEEPFRRLLVIRAKDKSPDRAQKPTAAEYDEAETILLGAYKRKTLYPTWRSAERTAAATRLLDWQALKVRLPEWRGAPEDRAGWQAALRLRSKPAVVDPDLTMSNYLRVSPSSVPTTPTTPAESATQLWKARRTALEAKVAAIKAARVAGAASNDQGFSAALTVADTPPLLTRTDLTDLRARSTAGAAVSKRLAQLGLDGDSFQYLSRIDELVSAVPAQPVDGAEWDEVCSILAELWKRRQVYGWRRAERAAGITLAPDCFNLPAIDWNQFPPPLPADPPRWRATVDQRQTWEDRLQARIDQDRDTETAIERIVGAVEEATLPQLRDALIGAVPPASLPGGASAAALSAKPKVLSEQLLIDLQMSGCAKTTRVAQAIASIQDLLFSLRGGFLNAYPSWKLTAAADASFDAVWMWLGSYATWRAAMFVLLYPENLLVPSLRRDRTPAFSRFLGDLRSRGTISVADTTEVMDGFVAYLRDVSELTITPGPVVDSKFVDENETVPIALSPTRKVPVRFLFGLAPSSHQIYWSIVFRGQRGEVQSSWKVLKQFKNDVASVVGSTPYKTADGRRFLYVFVLSSRDGEDHLAFARFGLETEGRWSPAEAEPLEVAGETHFKKVELLGTLETVPPAVRVTTNSGSVLQVQLGVKGLASGITTSTAGTPLSWGPVHKAPAVADLVGRQKRIEGGFALRQGSLGTRYDLVLLILSVGRTAANFYWGELRVVRGIGADGSPPAPTAQGLFEPVGDRRTAPGQEHLSQTSWAFGADSPGNRPLACAITVADIDGDQKQDLVIVHISEGFTTSPAQMFCRLGLGLNDDGTADSWVNSSTPMFASLPSSPGPCAVTLIRRGSGTFDLLVAGSGGVGTKTIWLKKITVRLQGGVLTFSNAVDGPTFAASNTVDGLGIGIADLDSDGVGELLVQWTERDATGMTANKLRYGPSIDGNGFPAGWNTPIDVIPDLYQGGSASFLPGHSGLAVGSLTGVPGRTDAFIAMFPTAASSSSEWRYVVANNIGLQFSPTSGQVVPTGQYKPFLISPLVPQSYDYRVGADRTYAPGVAQVWSRNAGKTRINQLLIEEAFFFAPLALALQLQRSGDFLGALDWFRSIYDYSVASNIRALYPGLEPNPGGSNVWREPNWMWLQDPRDPHGIAKGRNDTYKRFILQAVIRCLLEFADAEFTRDTSESITLARTLYLEALDLLEEGDLKQTYNGCDRVREWINFVIGELAPSVGPQTWDEIFEITRSGSRQVLSTVSTTLTKAYANGAMTAEDEAQIHAAASVAAMAPPVPVSLGPTLAAHAQLDEQLTQAFLSDARYTTDAMDLTAGAGESLEHVFTETFGTSYHDGMFEAPIAWNDLAEGTRELLPGGGFTDPPLDSVRDLFTSFLDKLGRNELTVGLQPSGNGKVVGGREFEPPKVATGPNLLTIQACVPPNPVLRALRLRAELNLYKIRTCRSITGERRQVDPYSAATDSSTGMPSIGSGGQLVLPGLANMAPTPYRFSVLIERAKSLVQLAQQTENAMLAAIQGGDSERYNAMKARQDLDNAGANVKLQTLRITEANSGITLAQLQRARAQIEVDQYNEWLQAGLSSFEQTAVGAMWVSFGLNAGVALYYGGAAIAAASAVATAALAPGLAASAAGAGAQASAQLAQIYQFWASYDDKRQNWRFQRNLAQQDRKIADQEYYISQDQLRVVTQEQTIASLNESHASATIEFLAQKFTNTDLYDWMADVLQGVYRYFLQQSAGTARIAAAQLAFERQQAPPPFIQSDYWQPPSDDGASANGKSPDRRGLTGSARLIQDITQLDQHAFATDSRKLQLSKTISLAQLAPLEFQQFRENGVLSFATPMELFDRDFPGHYLRLVHKVKLSLLALTPPALGIRATLTANRVSRVVIGGDLFQTVRVSHGPDLVALSSPREATGLFDLDIQPSMLAPFENIGVSTTWELRLPRAANPFDFSTIADVFFTIDYTALNSFDYRQQVIPRLGRRVSAQRGWSFRYQFADQWYELNNPSMSTSPMKVRFETTSDDFPPNVEADSLTATDIALHFVRRSGARFEVSPVALRFKERGSATFVGGSATTVDGTISTASGSAGSWMTMQAKAPIGQWELSLPDTEEMRGRFEGGDILDAMLVLTYSGRLPEWPG